MCRKLARASEQRHRAIIMERLLQYIEYTREMNRMAGKKAMSYEAAADCYYEHLDYPDSFWIDIEVPEEKEPIGFVQIGTRDNCHPDADWYICEAYIEKKYRRQGLMRTVMSEFIQTHPGTYNLFIYDKNEAAKAFWSKLFEEEGYRQVKLPDIGKKHRGLTQYGYTNKS